MLRLKGEYKNIRINGQQGTWYIIDSVFDRGRYLYLLESEQQGEDCGWLCVDENKNFILGNIFNGVGDVLDHLRA